MTKALARRHLGRGNDEGMALITVIGVMFIVMALLLTMLAIALRDTRPARTDQDQQAAVAAAQAGIDDYLGRLMADANYATKSIDPDNPAMKPGGRPVPGGVTGARYRYEVLSNALKTGDGSVIVKVTGSVNGQDRTFTTTFRPRGFLDYIYLTNLENLSPRYGGMSGTRCEKRWWELNGRSGRPCTEIRFASGDVITGPMHTNDTPLLDGRGVKFLGKATTSTEINGRICQGVTCYRNGRWWPNRSTYSFGEGSSRPQHAPIVGLPTGNSELKARARDSRLNGCYFTGATHISFHGKTMKVFSPSTTTNTCGFNAANRGNTQTLPVPDGNVIYVDGMTGTCEARHTQQNTAQLRQVTGRDSSYPLADEIVPQNDARSGNPATRPDMPTYDCERGTLYVQGRVDGKLTMGTAEDIVVTGDLTLANDPEKNRLSDDIIGLVPTSTVWVYHPVTTRGADMLTVGQRVQRIDAAILTLTDSFIVQHHNKGRHLGKLKVVGAIAQNYRGTVGTTGGNGYLKDYVYDPRFKTGAISPPFFLTPTSGAWEAAQIVEG